MMVELRARKRRKVSSVRQRGREKVDEDEALPGIIRDIDYSSPPVSNEQHDDNISVINFARLNGTPKSTRLSGSALGNEKRSEDDHDESDGDNHEFVASPLNKMRSSTRQRKVPQRYVNDVINMPKGSTRNAATLTNAVRIPRGVLKVSENVETGSTARGDHPSSMPKCASKRRIATTGATTHPSSGEANGTATDQILGENINGEHEDDRTSDDDLVAAQLQKDLTPQFLNRKKAAIISTNALPRYVEKFGKFCQRGFPRELRILTKLVLEKLTGRGFVPLKGLKNEYQKVYQLIEQTVVTGEGNSMLILGSRGCGKTAMVESIISSISRHYRDDFHVVRLNGFLHTDDRLAVREILRQLDRETNTEDEVAKVNSYADTMATLLALLSHPEELFDAPGTSETMATAKSVVIVLDEFDLFVYHPRQTLLYNLFDIAQARKAPIAVIGLTTKLDVTESLEKRVKSRFSHRHVFLPFPRTFEAFSDICFAGMSLEDEDLSEHCGSTADGMSIRQGVSLLQTEKGMILIEGWRSYLSGLWNDKQFDSHLKDIYHRTKCVKDFFTSALQPLSILHHSTYEVTSNGIPLSLQIPTPSSFTSHPLSCPDPALLPLPPLDSNAAGKSSVLPLSLLLAATRLTALHEHGLNTAHTQAAPPLTISFSAAYAEYVRLLTSAKASASALGAAATPGRIWGRGAARESWERLIDWGIVIPVGGVGTSLMDGRMYRIEISFQEAAAVVGDGGSLGKWWRDG